MADDTSTDPTPDPAPTPDEPAKGDQDALGDAGKKALDAERKAKREAEKRADDLEARLKEFEDRDKTESQKLAERAEAAEKAVEAARAEALRFKIAAKFHVSDEDADLFLTGKDEETLTRQAERLAARDEAAGKPRPPKPDLTQGGKPGDVDPGPGINRLRAAYAQTK